MRPLRALALIALMTSAVQGLPAYAGALDEIRQSGELRLAYRMESPPFSSKAPDALAPEGFTIDICRIIARDIQSHLGLDEMKITWVKVDADERIQAIADGRAHIECGITSVTLSRQEHVDFSNLFYATGASLMILNSSEIRNIDDLGNKRVSVVEGTTTEHGWGIAFNFNNGHGVSGMTEGVQPAVEIREGNHTKNTEAKHPPTNGS